MEVRLTPDQQAFVRQAIETGRLEREEDAVQEAFQLWEARERNRIEILAALDAAENDLETGNFRDYTDETLPQLAEELKREGRASRDRELASRQQ